MEPRRLSPTFAGQVVLASAVDGLLLAGGLMAVAFWFGRGSLGLGEAKLGAFVGGFLGIAEVPHYLMFGTLHGEVLALLLLIADRIDRTPSRTSHPMEEEALVQDIMLDAVEDQSPAVRLDTLGWQIPARRSLAREPARYSRSGWRPRWMRM